MRTLRAQIPLKCTRRPHFLQKLEGKSLSDRVIFRNARAIYCSFRLLAETYSRASIRKYRKKSQTHAKGAMWISFAIKTKRIFSGHDWSFLALYSILIGFFRLLLVVTWAGHAVIAVPVAKKRRLNFDQVCAVGSVGESWTAHLEKWVEIERRRNQSEEY